MQNNKPKQADAAKEAQRLATLEAQKIKEVNFKLVVKIISWENGSPGSAVVQASNKITPGEWHKYKTHRLNAFSEAEKDKIKAELTQSYNAIKANGGFA